MFVAVESAVLLQAVIGFAMHFTAYQLGVETRKGHARDVSLGTGMAVLLTVWSLFIGTIMIRMIPNWVIANEVLNEFGQAISAALSATDPVAVSALMLTLSNHHATKKLGVTLETESLFNDPIALYFFMVAMGRTQEAIDGIVWALAATVIILAISVFTLIVTKSRYLSTTVRVASLTVAMFLGVYNEAATITLGVASGFVVGLFEAPYHHESHKVIDTTLFWFGTIVLVLSILMAFNEIVIAIGDAATYAGVGGVFMILLRLFTRTIGVGLMRKLSPWRELAIGGSGAVGVLAIAVAEFHSHGEVKVAGFLAGCAVMSLAFFIPLTIKWFLDYKNGASHEVEFAS